MHSHFYQQFHSFTKRQGPRNSPRYYEPGKIDEPKEIPSCLILHLLVVFTQQLKILVTALFNIQFCLNDLSLHWSNPWITVICCWRKTWWLKIQHCFRGGGSGCTQDERIDRSTMHKMNCFMEDCFNTCVPHCGPWAYINNINCKVYLLIYV